MYVEFLREVTLPVEMVKSAPVSSWWINNILYQRLWSCNGLFTDLAYQQEGGALYASVKNVECWTNVEPIVTPAWQALYEPSEAERGLPLKR